MNDSNNYLDNGKYDNEPNSSVFVLLKKDHTKLFKLQDTVFLHIDFGEKNDFTTLGLLILTWKLYLMSNLNTAFAVFYPFLF